MIFNAWHDGLTRRRSGVSRKKWHWVKWLMFYPSLVYLVVTTYSWQYWAIYAIGAWVAWKLIYKEVDGNNPLETGETFEKYMNR